MNKRSQQKEQTRERILASAHRLFAAKGFATVNTLDIATQAKISHGSLFVHFPTRNALIIAVISRFGEKMAARVHDLAEAKQSLKTVLEAHLEILRENELFYVQLLLGMSIFPTQARLQIIAIQSAVSHHICLTAHKEIKKGKVMPLADDLLFNTWIGLLHYYLTNREMFVGRANSGLQSSNGSVIETHGQKLLNHFMNLITIKTQEA